MRKILTLGLLIFSFNVGAIGYDFILDVTSIAKKTPKQVAKIIGKPTRCSKVKWGKKCEYWKSDIEIIFMSNEAEWITIGNMGDNGFDSFSLRSLGLNNAVPYSQNHNVKIYMDINGLAKVRVFNMRGYISYAYIQVTTY